MSGLLWIVLSVCIYWFHNMVTLPFWLVSTDFGTCSYQCFLSICTPVSLHMLKYSFIIIIIIIIICRLDLIGNYTLLFMLCFLQWLVHMNYSLHFICLSFSPHVPTAPSGPSPPHYQGFTITLRHTTLGTTPLAEWSARRRDLYLTTHHCHNRPTSMPPAKFEPTIPASDRPQTHALDRSATGTGCGRCWMHSYFHQIAALSLQLSLLLLCPQITNKELFRTDNNIKYGCEICTSHISVHVDIDPSKYGATAPSGPWPPP